MKILNILAGISPELPEELTQVLLDRDDLRIERIVSRGQASAADFWYDQEQDEWVLVICGRARLQFEASGELVDMKAGDYLQIPAHTRHRVDWTDPDQKTIWLAVFCP